MFGRVTRALTPRTSSDMPRAIGSSRLKRVPGAEKCGKRPLAENVRRRSGAREGGTRVRLVE